LLVSTEFDGAAARASNAGRKARYDKLRLKPRSPWQHRVGAQEIAIRAFVDFARSHA
jgi:hypothetical protein